MWVMLAMFWASGSDSVVDLKVYKDRVFASEEQCKEIMLFNQKSIVKSLGELGISSRYSVKCIDANKYPYLFNSIGTIQS